MTNRFKSASESGRSRPLIVALDQYLFAYFVRLTKTSDWKPIATAPADADVELSIYDQGEYHTLVFPCRRDGYVWRDVSANRPMPLEPTHWRLWGSRSV
jgi:hypothetical protein